MTPTPLIYHKELNNGQVSNDVANPLECREHAHLTELYRKQLASE